MNKIALASRLSLRIMLVVMLMAIVIMAVVYPITLGGKIWLDWLRLQL